LGDGTLKAVVTDLGNGEYGDYGITYADGFTGSITFSLKPECWTESKRPKKGDVVSLSNISKSGNGWRANKASF
jgi:hypothetical protein